MEIRGRRLATVTLALATVAMLGAGAASAQIPDKFTNLQVYPKEMTKADLLDAMKSFSAALGVRCTYCHVGEEKPGVPAFQGFKFDADDKAPKKVARAMMKMMADVNVKYLKEIDTGRDRKVQVGCMTCHRGIAVPKPLADVVLEAIREKGIDAGIAKYREIRRQYEGTMAYDFGDGPLTDVTKVLAAEEKNDDGIAITKLNAEFHPKSVRVFLNLGEFYMARGDKASAADAYRKVLELTPDNEMAKKRLAEATKAGS